MSIHRGARAIAAVSVVAASLVLGASDAAHGAPGVTRAHLYHVMIGVDTTLGIVTVNKFVPDKLTVHSGDRVQWTNAVGYEPQTVTFGPLENIPPLFTRADGAEINPTVVRPQGGSVVGDTNLSLFSSGALMSGIRGLARSYTFTFRAPGKYLYRSLFHPGALGEIDVVGAKRVASPDPADRGPSLAAALRSTAQALQDDQPAENHANAYEGTTVVVGTGNGDVTLNKFAPSGITIKAGSTLTFAAQEVSGDPHALLFNDLSQHSVPLYTGLSADGGLALNRTFVKATLASGSAITSPSQRVTSGILYGSSITNPSRTPSSFAVTFPNQGQYYVLDPFHQPGMLGQITVLPS